MTNPFEDLHILWCRKRINKQTNEHIHIMHNWMIHFRWCKTTMKNRYEMNHSSEKPSKCNWNVINVNIQSYCLLLSWDMVLFVAVAVICFGFSQTFCTKEEIQEKINSKSILNKHLHESHISSTFWHIHNTFTHF